MRRFVVMAALAAAAQLAHAAEAGKIIFVAGKASVADSAAREGTPVAEGQMLSTGADGFLYVKTIDSGLFILRPNTQARIVSYHIDNAHPENTRVKLELLSGVARSKSGNAVKLARQNFRFNTPVAAIGVRGTDFTVFTDNETSRVAVLSGAIVMSGFSGACRAEGAGPCEGGASRELSAAQRGQLLQVQRGQAAPQLMQSSPLSPDQVSPPRADEPLAHGSTSGSGASAVTGHANLDAEKTATLAAAGSKPPVTPPPVAPAVPVTPPPPDPVEPEIPVTPPVTPVTLVETAAQLPYRGIVWGRWQVVAGLAPKLILSMETEKNELLAINGNYILLRAPGKDDYVLPNNGSMGFQLKDSEAFVYTDYTSTYRVSTPANLSNGSLTVDFGNKSFATSVDLRSSEANATLRATGAVAADGRLYGEGANGKLNVMNVQGLLSNQNGGSAAYIFDARLDDKRTVNGATSWQKTN
jgi:hypothetical protein